MSIQELIEQPFGSVTEMIRLHERTRPRHPAIIQGDMVIDYAGLDALIDRVAGALQRDGLCLGDSIAICAATSIQYVATFLGCIRAGVAVAPLVATSTPESISAMLANAEAKKLFLDAPFAATWSVSGAAMEDLPRIALDGSGAGTPWTQWLGGAPTPKKVHVKPDSIFNLIYSSGTTGAPKGIMQTYAHRWGHVQRGVRSGYAPESVSLASTPMYSNTTLIGLFPALAVGGTVVLMEKFEAGDYLKLVERRRPTRTMLVPTQYRRLMEHPAFGRADLSSLKEKYCTGEICTTDLKVEVVRTWPGSLTEIYGLTEGGGVCALQVDKRLDKAHTVGVPVAGSDMRIIDNDGHEVAQGIAGEVVSHSHTMMVGYKGDTKKTKEVEWHDRSGKRFFRTGDIGFFDADGFLILMDRKKDMIISGGVNIYPSDIEAQLRRHPAIFDVAVVGVQSERWGETPVAFAVLRDGMTMAAESLRSWANERLGKLQRITDVKLCDTLPRNAVGKVLKRQLRDSYGRQDTH